MTCLSHSLTCLHEHRHTTHRVHTGLHNRGPICLYTSRHDRHTHLSLRSISIPQLGNKSADSLSSLQPLTLPLHCPLLTIDLCHSHVVSVSSPSLFIPVSLFFNSPLFGCLFSVHLSFWLFTPCAPSLSPAPFNSPFHPSPSPSPWVPPLSPPLCFHSL